MTVHTPQGRETRERILEAAAEVIHLHGVHGSTVDQILERAGAGKSQFYHYFRSKDDLVRRVVELQAQRTLATFGPGYPPLSRWEGIRAWMDRVRTHHRARGFQGGCPLGSLAAEMGELSDELRGDLVKAFERVRRPLERGLQMMKEEGHLAPDADPDRLARFTVAALQGGLLLAATEHREEPLEDALENAYRHLRNHGAEGAAG